ncbi:MAG: VOC family protein [Pseudomonadota bacterium]
MVSSVDPFLMFEGSAETAMSFYVSVFPDSRIEAITRYGPDGPGAEGTVIHAKFVVAGRAIQCSDSPMPHPFSFTPSMSLFVTCESAEEIERLSAALANGGEVLMPLDDYGFSRKFAWLNDKFGVSWQLNLA